MMHMQVTSVAQHLGKDMTRARDARLLRLCTCSSTISRRDPIRNQTRTSQAAIVVGKRVPFLHPATRYRMSNISLKIDKCCFAGPASAPQCIQIPSVRSTDTPMNLWVTAEVHNILRHPTVMLPAFTLITFFLFDFLFC